MADHNFNFTNDGFITPTKPSKYLFDFGGLEPYYSFEEVLLPEPPVHNLVFFNFDFVNAYRFPEEYDFGFDWVVYKLLKGFSNNFTSIWAAPDASMCSGKMYVGSSDSFSIVNLATNTIYDYYTTTHSGLRGEILTSSGVIDLYIQGA